MLRDLWGWSWKGLGGSNKCCKESSTITSWLEKKEINKNQCVIIFIWSSVNNQVGYK